MMFPGLLGSSNQYAVDCASIPSLALISEQDSAGNWGIDPSGTNGKNKLKNLNVHHVHDYRKNGLIISKVNLAELLKGVT